MSVLKEIYEKDTLVVTAAFYDDASAAVTPTSATYRIHDKASGTIIKAVTTLTGLGTTKAIEVTSAENALVNANDNAEEHILTLAFDYGASRHGSATYRWVVKGLEGVA